MIMCVLHIITLYLRSTPRPREKRQGTYGKWGGVVLKFRTGKGVICENSDIEKIEIPNFLR